MSNQREVDWDRIFKPGLISEMEPRRRPMFTIEVGDVFTVAGLHSWVKNPKRKWWQFWKPARVKGPLQTFRVTDHAAGSGNYDHDVHIVPK